MMTQKHGLINLYIYKYLKNLIFQRKRSYDAILKYIAKSAKRHRIINSSINFCLSIGSPIRYIINYHGSKMFL